MAEESNSRISRGRFMKLGGALGVGVAGAPVLASCGSGGGGGSGGEAIAQQSEVAPGGAV